MENIHLVYRVLSIPGGAGCLPGTVFVEYCFNLEVCKKYILCCVDLSRFKEVITAAKCWWLMDDMSEDDL